MEILIRKRRISMNNTELTTLVFLTGLESERGSPLCFAPRSGEETREWIADTPNRNLSCCVAQAAARSDSYRDAVAKGRKVTRVLRNGKKALESVAAKLD